MFLLIESVNGQPVNVITIDHLSNVKSILPRGYELSRFPRETLNATMIPVLFMGAPCEYTVFEVDGTNKLGE